MAVDWSVVDNYYDRIAHLYDATRPLPTWVSDQIADRILQQVEATPQTRFLEPGIGTGRTGFPLIKMGYSYTGIDISINMMNELKAKFPQMPKNLNLIQGDASHLPFTDDAFDVVLTTHMLHCLTDPLMGLSEIRRVLNSTGVFIACENLLSARQQEIWAAFSKIIRRYPAKEKARIEDKFNPFGNALQAKLQSQGAVVEKITLAEWQQTESVEEILNAFQSKAFGLCWLISEVDFQEAIKAFEQWCIDRFGSFEATFANNFQFDVMIARHWS
ncbi:MAG: class I SAM-dependent methyltransferase [Cyanobacteria bacterium P01_A01_bin.17]